MRPNVLVDLNDIQQKAVTHFDGNLLVLAGAGSGKTRVLVHRIAWLLSQDIHLHNILAVTFTNKAAKEMRSRLEGMLGFSMATMWIGTFHGLAHKLLRIHWKEAGLDENFQIIDSEDQNRLLKRIHKALNLDKDRYPVKQSQIFINSNKERGVRADKASADNFEQQVLVKVYQAYEKACINSGLVDFSELLLRSYELWQNNKQIREEYKERFKHILVDEFQDTNAIQYAWIKSISNFDSGLTVVGDDDQSIYSWRGADSGNMKRLSEDYSNVNVVRLEQNYRSTSTILKAANAVIANNSNRMGKNLWTDSGDGEAIVLYNAFNEIDEARYISDKINDWCREGGSLNDVAILYRSNAQSRAIEEQLLRAGISYRVYGGMRFFERAEIKDVLSYLRLLVNRHDDAAFERVVNLPSRGVGEASLIFLRNYARLNDCSMWQAVQDVIATKQLSSRAENALNGFVRLINAAADQINNLELADLVEYVINISRIREHYSKPQYAEYKQSRLENLDELISAAGQFASTIVEEEQTLLGVFLSHVALESGDKQDRESYDNVQLMTLHSAKGLEFPLVFLCGLEEGLFPHIMSMGSQEELEEERRLCYVGMTRAKKKLYLSSAESRQLHGSTSMRRSSRFLREIPTELIESNSMVNSVSPAFSEDISQVSQVWNNKSRGKSRSVTASFKKEQEEQGFSLGQNVYHKEFGDGVITNFEGHGEWVLVRINFKRHGSKLLSLQHAQIEKR